MLLGMMFEGNIQAHSILQSPGTAGPGWMCQQHQGIAADCCEELEINRT